MFMAKHDTVLFCSEANHEVLVANLPEEALLP